MKDDKKDVSMNDDIILYLQNAIACENHCIMSYASSDDKKYLDMAQEIRKNRSKWLYKFVLGENENYCISKHLLVCATALKEMSNRFMEENEKELADECIKEAELYENLFVELNKSGGKNE